MFDFIFIYGAPRSGTTFIADLLSRYNEVLAVPESQFLIENLALNQPIEMQKVFGHRRFGQWGLLRSELDDNETASALKMLSRLSRAYWKKNFPDRDRVRLIVEHTPEKTLYLPSMLKSHPNQKHVFVVRDPRAIVASLLKQNWGPNTAISASASVNRYYSPLALLAVNTAADISIVRYEDAVVSDNGQIAEALGINGLTPGNESGLKLPNYTKVQHKLVGSPGSLSRIDAWRNELNQKQVRQIEAVLHPLISALGYDCVPPAMSDGISTIEKTVDGITGTFLDTLRTPGRVLRRYND